MNILIYDDVLEDSKQLEDLLCESGHNVNTDIFQVGYDAIDFIHSGAVIDLCFLDIVTPEMSGVDLAYRLRQDGYTGEIVFLSTSKEYGPEAIDVSAFGYLIKPPTAESLKNILSKLERVKSDIDKKSIMVKASGVAKVIPYRNISHTEVIKHKVYFQLTDGNEVEVYSTFIDIAKELLLDPRFIQCHRSYIVNMQDIVELSEKLIVTSDGTKIPISRSYREAREKFYEWRFGDNSKVGSGKINVWRK